ncbi:MAG: hypothetical protein U9O78_01600 [Patescibacteria group bacterium]|nr:hypothetical protein [Patescibacteria group bacterium]
MISKKQNVQKTTGLLWWQALLILAGLGVLVTTIIKVITPNRSSPPTPNIVDGSKKDMDSDEVFSNIVYEGPSLAIDRSLKIYQPKQTSITQGNIKEILLETYKLESHKSAKNVWVGPDYSLHKPEGKSEYQLSSTSSISSVTKIRPLAAINEAEKIINSLFGNYKLTPFEKNVEYFKGSYHLEPSSEEETQWVSVPFTHLIENRYPVYYEKNIAAIVEVLIGPKYTLQKATFSFPLLEFEQKYEKSTLSVENAVQNINNNNQTTIVTALTSQAGQLDLSKIKSGKLEECQLEYRFDASTGLLYPFYRFKGELINQNNKKIFAQIITPAIKI